MSGEQEIRQRVTEIVDVVFGVEPGSVLRAADASATEWDSLRHIEIILAVEEEFGISISEEDFAELRSVDGISAHIAGLGASH
jgi:acyl carrier protein